MAAHIDLAVEQIVVDCLWRYPGAAGAIVKGSSGDQLTRVAEQLVREMLPKHEDLIDETFVGLRKAREQRNLLLHRVWRPSADGAEVEVQPRPTASKAAAAEKRDQLAIEKLADDLAKVSLGLTVMRGFLGFEVPRERRAIEHARRLAEEAARTGSGG